MQRSSCGDLMELFGGLQIIELKLAMDDHELTKIYSLLISFIWVHMSRLNWINMRMLLIVSGLNGFISCESVQTN